MTRAGSENFIFRRSHFVAITMAFADLFLSDDYSSMGGGHAQNIYLRCDCVGNYHHCRDGVKFPTRVLQPGISGGAIRCIM
jgi:hypothetical protein